MNKKENYANDLVNMRNEEIQQMTALCSEPFVHYCQAKKERGREIGNRICFWASEHLHRTQCRTKEKLQQHTQCPYKIILEKLTMKLKGMHREALRCSVFLVRERFGPQCLSAGPIRINDRLFSKIRTISNHSVCLPQC